MKKTVIVCVIVVLIAATAGTAAYLWLRPETTQIKAHMYGVALTAEGEVYKNVEFDIAGRKIDHRGEEESELEVSIEFTADSFTPFTRARTGGYIVPTALPDHYLSSFFGYIPESNDLTACTFGLSTDLQYCAMKCMSDDLGYKYIVGSSSSDFDVEEILEMFDDIITPALK